MHYVFVDGAKSISVKGDATVDHRVTEGFKKFL